VPARGFPGLISAIQEKFGLDDRSIADQVTMKADSKAGFQTGPLR